MAKSKFSNESTFTKFLENGKEAEFHMSFDFAVESAKRSFGAKHPMYIKGKQVFATETLTEKSPIDGTVIGHFQKGTRENAQQAVRAAKEAFEEWKNRDYKERIEIFRKAADLFAKNKFILGAILSIENGKSRYESIGEVDEAIDFMRYYADDMEANKGYARKTVIAKSNKDVKAGFQGAPGGSEKISITMKPYGVFAVIAPFNFPVSISIGMSVSALITGNTVVFKPSSSDNMTMLTGLKIYQLLTEAGVPPGVFNYITGPGSEIGDELISSKDVSGVAFTGSRSIGIGMISKNYSMGLQKVFIVEMGGKNPAMVSKNADIDAAVEGIASAAFGYAGQKCSACSRVYVHESIKEVFVSKLIDKVRELKIGDPLKKENYIGPLISESAYKRYIEAIEKAKASGRVVYGGNPVQTGLTGYYVEPAIIELRHDHELIQKELFLPILTIESFKDFKGAILLANDVEYGLTAALYSKNKKEISEFMNSIEAGVVYINRAISATTGAIVGKHTFVGWKNSGLTGKGSGSKFYLSQFMREQSISITQ
jgi:1-pyrroline-5-carboxylate dehydrogenase